MKKMKKLFAVLLALVMVLGMSVTAFADEETPAASVTPKSEPISYPAETDRVDVKIGGITGNPKVTLYQIASADYGDNGGLIQYKWVEGNEIDFNQPTSGQIAEYANAIVNGKLRVNGDDKAGTIENGVYTANVSAGVYIAVITGANDGSVYNPILLTATYNRTAEGDTELIGGAINASEAEYLNGSAAVAKKTTPNIDKQITGGTVADETIKGNTLPEGTNTTTTPGPTQNATVSVGDSVEYTITPQLPSYPVEAINKKLAISDRASAGLTFQFGTLSMVLDGTLEVEKSEADADGVVTFTYDGKVIAYAKKADNGFNMTFVYDNLVYKNSNNEDAVYVPSIKYNAIVNNNAVVGSDGNTNTTTLYYTNQPNTDTGYDPEDNKGELPEGEDVKEKTDKETVYSYQLAFHKTGDANDADAAGLAGAVFGIYADAACTELIDIVTTNENGYAVSSQVGAGTYYIKEITAPDGYSLNDDVFEVEANWTTATTTISGEVTRRVYTSTKPADDAAQVGWLDQDNVFYNLDAAVTEGADGKVTSNVTGKELFAAYLESETTTTNSETFVESNDVTGTVASLKNMMTGDEGNTIPNTQLSSLPSTGGIGTTIFTIAGCLIMVVAAGLFFASRKKTAAK